jgi:hypothetical protein
MRVMPGDTQSSPVLSSDGTSVFIGCDDFHVYALSVASGDLLWKQATNSFVRSSAAVNSNGLLIIGSDDTDAYGLRQSTGEVVWMFMTGDVVRGRAVWGNNLAFIASNDQNVYAIADYVPPPQPVGAIVALFVVAAVLIVGAVYVAKKQTAAHKIMRLPRVQHFFALCRFR